MTQRTERSRTLSRALTARGRHGDRARRRGARAHGAGRRVLQRLAQSLFRHRLPRGGGDARRGHRRSRAGCARASRGTRGAMPRTTPAAVPVCRFFGTPGVGPELALLHRRRGRVRARQDQSELDVRGDRVLHRGAAGRRVPRGDGAGLPKLLSRRRPSAQSNHRFLPDLTMHQKMAPSSHARRRGDVRAAVHRRRSRPTPCACSSRRRSGPTTRSSRT